MTKDEALKLALEALEEAWYHVGTFQPTEKAIDLYDEARTAIKEALANVATNDTSQERVDKTSESVHEPVSIQRWPSAAIGKETLQDALKRENTTPPQRNDTLEEVAQEFDKMTALGDTAASFARFVRDMKR